MGYGNCRAVETVEKPTACFPTVPTALGKLGKNNRAEFPTVPTAPTAILLIINQKKKNPESEGIIVIDLDQIRMDKTRLPA